MATSTSRRAPSAGQVWTGLALVYVIWGSTYFAIRVLVHPSHGSGLPPLLTAGARFAVAGAVMLALTVRRLAPDGQPDPLGRPQWRAALVVGAALPAGGNGLVTVAEQHVASSAAALVIATVPLWVALIGTVRRTEPPSARESAGLVLGFGGVALLVAGRGGGSSTLEGLALVLVASLCWAAGSVYARTAPLPRRPLVGTGMEMLCGGGVLLAAGLLRGEASGLSFTDVPAQSWLAFGYLVAIGSMVGYTAYVWLVANVRLSLVTTYAYVNPAVAVALGALLLGERLTAATGVATAVILLGVAVVVSSSRPAEPA